jgi:hypothetical protein
LKIELEAKITQIELYQPKIVCLYIQKLTGMIHTILLKTIYQLEPNYDFTADFKGIRTKRVRKHTIKVLFDKHGDELD